MSGLRVAGALLIAVGVGAASIATWELVGTGIGTSQAQRAAGEELATRWEAAPVPDPPAPGDPIARLRIPRIDLDQVVLEGTDDAQLDDGPGHYPSTSLPGRPGNVGLAGHRVTHGAPFNRIDELQGCDEILVDDRNLTWVYQVLPTPGAPDCGLDGSVPGREIVSPDYTEVLDPMPGRALLTLTTCHPEFSATERLIVHAELVDTSPRTTD